MGPNPENVSMAADTVIENLQQQIELYKHMEEINKRQLAINENLIKELEGKSEIQDKLIDQLTKMCERLEEMVKERDDLIKSLRF